MLKFTIVVSENADKTMCGNCIHIDYMGTAFCELFGCENLKQKDGMSMRLPVCIEAEQAGSVITHSMQGVGI